MNVFEFLSAYWWLAFPIIGALAGYPLIKHCMNQGYDVVEFINGNTALTPADEKDLAAIFEKLPQRKSVSEWLEYLRTHVSIFADVSPLQMREFMLFLTAGACRWQGLLLRLETAPPGSATGYQSRDLFIEAPR